MHDIGSDLAQRFEHKSAQVHARVRNDEFRLTVKRLHIALTDCLAAEQKQIDVDDSRAVDYRPLSSNLSLDFY